MSERTGSQGWRIWKEKNLPQEVVPLSDAEGVVAKLEDDLKGAIEQYEHWEKEIAEQDKELNQLEVELKFEKQLVVAHSGKIAELTKRLWDYEH